MMVDNDSDLIRRPLTAELGDPRSPVRQFLDARLTAGLREVQRRYREAGPAIVVPAAAQSEANAGTVGGAADWMLRFLVYPEPALDLVMAGVASCRRTGIRIGFRHIAEVLRPLGLTPPLRPAEAVLTFDGPRPGSAADPSVLGRACWVLALLTEACRRGPAVAALGPLGRLRGREIAAEELLSLAPPAGLDQLARFRQVFEAVLLPALATRQGTWAIGPTFAGSKLMNADADLISAGLLLELKTTAKKPSLAVTDLFQLIGYALLDFDDEFSIHELALFSARYAYLTTWDISQLLDELAGHGCSLADMRCEFHDLLIRHTQRCG